MSPSISVIIPTYNAVAYLELVLFAFCRQSDLDFEVIIADDGSGPEVQSFIESLAPRSPFPLKYVYQPDEGFRKNRILNQAVKAAATGYHIFTDGDCLPHRDFVSAHWQHRASRTILCGRRVKLSRRLSESLTPEDVMAGRHERLTLEKAVDALLGRSSHWEEGIPIRNRILRDRISLEQPTLLGCNFSLEKSLIEEVNGFNEDFVGYGGADTEFECRLRLAGARFKWVRHLAIQYHLFHPSRTVSHQNVALLDQIKAEGKAACRNGLREFA